MMIALKAFSKSAITCSGSAAPPEPQARSEETSSPGCSAATSAAYMVGTPRKTVTWSRPMTSMALRGSKRGISVSVEAKRTAALRPQVRPKTWNRGRQPITTSSVVRCSSVRPEISQFMPSP